MIKEKNKQCRTFTKNTIYVPNCKETGEIRNSVLMFQVDTCQRESSMHAFIGINIPHFCKKLSFNNLN